MKMKKFLLILIFFAFLLSPASRLSPLAYAQSIDRDPVSAEGYLAKDKSGKQNLIIKMTIKPGWHAFSREPEVKSLTGTNVSFEKAPGVTVGKMFYPPPKKQFIQALEQEFSLYEGTVYLRAPVKIDGKKLKSKILKGTLHYQVCSDKICLRPVKKTFAVSLTPSSVIVIPESTFPGTGLSGKSGKTATGTGPDIAGLLQKQGMFLTLLGIFIWGLGLNLTPCVYPMIPITLAIFAGQKRDKKATLFAACAYVLGLAVTYSSLGVGAALTGTLFGSALQSKPAVIFVAAIFSLLALSLFGFYELNPPSWVLSKVSGSGSSRGGSAPGALFMGLVAGLVAAPCIGPVVLALLIYVGKQGNAALGFLLFFVLSLGLGFPYIFLALFSSTAASLPKSGGWLVLPKIVFGAMLVGLSFYYLRNIVPGGYLVGMAGCILIGLAAAVMSKDSDGINVRTKGAVLTVSFLLVYVFVLNQTGALSSVARGVETFSGEHIAWVYSEPEGWEKARLEKKPVMIDFYSAIWCPACIEFDKYTYPDQRVVEKSRRFVNIKLDVDKNKDAKDLMKKYDVFGIPTIILYDSSGQEVHRVVGFENAEAFLKILKNVP